MVTAFMWTQVLQLTATALSLFIHRSIRRNSLLATATSQEQSQVRKNLFETSYNRTHSVYRSLLAGTDACGNTVGIGGTFNFKGMVAGGFLDATGAAADGIDYRFDNCSQTVSLRIPHQNCKTFIVFVTSLLYTSQAHRR